MTQAAWAAPIRRTWERLPLVGRVFVALAVVDIVARAFGIFGERLPIDLDVPFTLVSAFLPHDALIVLPALIVARRPDADRATPLILRGAVAVAIVELVRGPLGILPFDAPRGDPMVSWTVNSILATVVAAAGWLAIAVGIAMITPPAPRPTVEGFANLAAGVIVLGAIAWVIVAFTRSADVGDAGWNAMILVATVLAPVALAVWGYLARVVIRGLGDGGRPPAAIGLGAFAMALTAIGAALVVLDGAAAAVLSLLEPRGGYVMGALDLGWFGTGLATTTLVVAFGLGLADNSVRIPGAIPASQVPPPEEPEPLRWPAPGGEVPQFRPVQPPSSPPPPKRVRRRKPKESEA